MHFEKFFRENKDKYQKTDMKTINKLVIEGSSYGCDAYNVCGTLTPNYEDLSLTNCDISNFDLAFHSNLRKLTIKGYVSLSSPNIDDNNNNYNNTDDNNDTLCPLEDVTIDYRCESHVKSFCDNLEKLERNSCFDHLKSIQIIDRANDDDDEAMLLPPFRMLLDHCLMKRRAISELELFCIKFDNIQEIGHLFYVMTYFINNVDNIKHVCLSLKEFKFEFELEPEYVRDFEFPEKWKSSNDYKSFAIEKNAINLTYSDLTGDKDKGYGIFGTMQSMWQGINEKQTKTIFISLKD